MEQAQLDWLEAEVTRYNVQTQPQVLVVLAHHPLQDTTTKSTKAMMNIHNSNEVWTRLAELKRGRGFYFNGHNHVNSIALRDNWTFVEAGAIYSCADYQVCDIFLKDDTALEVKILTQAIANGSESSFELANRLGRLLHD